MFTCQLEKRKTNAQREGWGDQEFRLAGFHLPLTTLPSPAPEVLQVRRTCQMVGTLAVGQGCSPPPADRPTDRPQPLQDTPSTYLQHGRGALARQRAAQERREKLCHIRAGRPGPPGARRLRPRPAPELGWAGRTEAPGPGRGAGIRPAKAVRSGVSGPAGSSGLPLRRCPGERSRQPRAPQPRRRGSPAALAGPAECHQRRSKGKGPAEGEAGGPTAHDPRRLPGQGRRAQRGGGDAATGRPAPGQ